MEKKIWRNPNMYYNMKKLYEKKSDFIVFDLETTGLDASADRIIQIAAIKMHFVTDDDFEETDRLNLYINPRFHIEPKIEKLTGITNKFLKTCRTEKEVFPEILSFFGNTPVCVGYNIAGFDIEFLKKLYSRHYEIFHCMNVLDVLCMARDFIPYKDTKGYKLKQIADYYEMSRDITFHNAMDDTLATTRLLRIFAMKYQKEYSMDFGDIRPHISNFFVWQGKRHDLRRIYFCTNIGNIYYNCADYSWGAKDIDLSIIDLPYLAIQAYSYGGALNDDDFYHKWAKKQFEKPKSQ